MPIGELAHRARAAQERVVSFCARLVRASSLTGQEGAVAALVADEMRALAFDHVSTDAAGNVVGCLRGGSGRSLMLHAHMDIVDPGDPAQWTYGPFAGELADGHIWGRGAVDDKGCLAAQVYAAGLLREAGITPPGDLYIAAVVGEEVGGVGTRHLVEHLHPDVAIIGEPSNNTLRRGHRGRFEFIVTLHGRSTHASIPHKALNPHYSMSRFLLALREAPMAQSADFGASTVAPTLAYVDQTSSNVIPAAASVHLDWRNSPGETVAQARALIEGILAATAEPGIRAEVRIATRDVRSYTGLTRTISHAVTPFWIAPDDRRLLAAQGAISEALGRAVPIEIWPFFTDGGFLHAAGVPCIGFGPGDPAMAHVVDERLPVAELVDAVAGYMALASRLGRTES